MTAIRSSFTSQSPAWMAASIKGTPSWTTEPNRIAAGKTHTKAPTPTAPCQPTIPRRETKYASMKATTRLWATTNSTVQTDVPESAAAAGSTSGSSVIALPNSAYHTTLATNAATAATTIAA